MLLRARKVFLLRTKITWFWIKPRHPIVRNAPGMHNGVLAFCKLYVQNFFQRPIGGVVAGLSWSEICARGLVCLTIASKTVASFPWIVVKSNLPVRYPID